jgi:hypothetical protein
LDTRKKAQAERRRILKRVRFMTIKNAKRSEGKAWSWSFTDFEESTSSPRTRRGASSFHVKKAKCSRRQSLTLAVFNDAEEITSGPKTTLGARLFVTVKESQVVLLTERGARRLRDSEECQAVGRQSLEWVCFEALKNVQAIRRQSLERVVFMTIGNASGPKTRLGKKLQRKQDPRESPSGRKTRLGRENGTALTERFMVSNGC